jgi:DNA-binding transcriptional LysR family regulator
MMNEYPELKVFLDFDDDIRDVTALGFDAAIRIAVLKDSELVARKLAENPMTLCASPAYLEKWGRPQRVEDLSGHACLQLRANQHWTFLRGQEQLRVLPNARMIACDVESVRAACQSGLGIAYLARSDMKPMLANGSVEAIRLDDVRGLDLCIWAIMNSKHHVPARVRTFLNLLESELRAESDRA